MTFGSSVFGTTPFGGVAPLKKIANIAYEKAKGTPTEEITQSVKEDIQRWH